MRRQLANYRNCFDGFIIIPGGKWRLAPNSVLKSFELLGRVRNFHNPYFNRHTNQMPNLSALKVVCGHSSKNSNKSLISCTCRPARPARPVKQPPQAGPAYLQKRKSLRQLSSRNFVECRENVECRFNVIRKIGYEWLGEGITCKVGEMTERLRTVCEGDEKVIGQGTGQQ